MEISEKEIYAAVVFASQRVVAVIPEM